MGGNKKNKTEGAKRKGKDKEKIKKVVQKGRNKGGKWARPNAHEKKEGGVSIKNDRWPQSCHRPPILWQNDPEGAN